MASPGHANPSPGIASLLCRVRSFGLAESGNGIMELKIENEDKNESAVVEWLW
jgi:hypothetical protein